jgi:RimJ/RimL family protein N-acetyltransferase
LNQTGLKKLELMEIKLESTLFGKYVVLRKSEISDAQFIFDLRTSNAGKFLRQPIGYDLKSQENWMKTRPSNEINYIIKIKNTNQNVGTISIYDINLQDRIANVGRLILVDEYLKKSNPYGLESLLLTYGFVFNNLNFRKITGDILASNTDMLKFQLYLGMSQEGLLKEHVFLQNKYQDLHIMSIFKDKYILNYEKRINFLLKSFK